MDARYWKMFSVLISKMLDCPKMGHAKVRGSHTKLLNPELIRLESGYTSMEEVQKCLHWLVILRTDAWEIESSAWGSGAWISLILARKPVDWPVLEAWYRMVQRHEQF